MNTQLIAGISAAFKTLFDAEISIDKLSLQPTRKEFKGSHTFVTFPYGKISKKKPEETGNLLGTYLKEHLSMVSGFNVVKGFLNIELSDTTWLSAFQSIATAKNYGTFPANGEKVMVEYSSPNTNKPLHLGHLRNNFLGFSVSKIFEANGYEVMKTNLVNDRGIHICKSMLAYKRFGNNEIPTNDLKGKGDKMVGKYYVKFDQEYKKEIQVLFEKYKTEFPNSDEKELKTKAEKNAPMMLEVQNMLQKWEKGDKETIALWTKLNQWVYDGFEQSYKLMGVTFDKIYHESETYLLGKDIIKDGLSKNIFFKKEDGSVWIDLTKDKLDEKLVLRGDGTSVYITQDMGTADLKFQDFPMQKSVYVIGNEQDYHMKVLKLIMQKLGRNYADGLYHLSYGMVDLPTGKMKSREGTVVDADDLIHEMIATAKSRTEELGKIDGFTETEAEELYHKLALGALKYYLLKVEPKKRMLFNPEESIDFQGDTGVYIQFNHAKAKAILRKAISLGISTDNKSFASLTVLHEAELSIINLLVDYPSKVAEAGKNYSPSVIANYCYNLAKAYSKFWAEVPIFTEENAETKSLRVAISQQVALVLNKGMKLIGVEMPEKM